VLAAWTPNNAPCRLAPLQRIPLTPLRQRTHTGLSQCPVLHTHPCTRHAFVHVRSLPHPQFPHPADVMLRDCAVTKCAPPVAKINDYLAMLNSTKSFCAFVRAMRREFRSVAEHQQQAVAAQH
jgi:hypothetical protein